MQQTAKILITGSTGMVGAALVRYLKQQNYTQLLIPSHAELDLINQAKVYQYFYAHKPEYVFHCAARVGGIYANNHYRAEFIYENTQMHCNVIHTAFQVGVTKLLFPGSACTYPKNAAQPIQEISLLDGRVEPTNEAYAIAKLNGISMCQAYRHQYGFNAIVAMPTNAYGIGDQFTGENAHVIPALMQRLHQAKLENSSEVVMWGSGKPLREFIYVDDLAEALVFLMLNYNDPDIINIGTMQEVSMFELAQLIAETVGYAGQITLDTTRPDGIMRKCLNNKKLVNLGWQPRTSLQEGLMQMYQHHYPSS